MPKPDFYTKEERRLRKQAAKDAIELMGGYTKAITKLNMLTKMKFTEAQVRNWIHRGVPSELIPTFHMLSNIPCHEFDPVIYPKWMFNDKF